MTWYCIKSKPGGEYQALNNLQGQQIFTYLPETPVDVRYHRFRPRKSVPMFTGYLFAYLEPGITNFSSIKHTRGVSYIVSFSGEPAKLTEAEILAIRQAEKALKPPKEYLAGEVVRIKGGRFDGLEAVFAARTGRERADILMTFLGKNQRVNISLKELEPAAENN